MDNSLVKQLYDFLLENQLIAPDISEEESLDLLERTIDNLDEDENILTGFIVGSEDQQKLAYIVTDQSKLKNNLGESLNTDYIESIEITPEANINVNTPEENLTFIGSLPVKANAVSDALYTALSELLPEERINEIFAQEPEEEVEDEIETEIPEEIEPEILEVSEIPEEEITEEHALEPTSTDLTSKDLETTPSDFPVLTSNSNQEEGKEAVFAKKKANFNKPLMYVLGAVFIIAVGVIAYFVITNMIENSQSGQKADELVNYINQIDAVYYQAEDYVNKGIGGSTPENWSQLNTQAVAIQEEMYNFEPTEKTNDLYQSIYFYNDALITALYYGQSYSASGNAGQLEICKQRLQNAYQNRLAALVYLDENYPNLYDKLEHATNLKDEDIGYNSDEIDQLIDEANSKPSNEARENSKSSNEARENSRMSD